MVRDRKTCLPVDSLWWIECHWVQFIRATRGRVLFPFAFLLFFAKWLKANLYFLRFEINLFVLFAEGKVSWTVWWLGISFFLALIYFFYLSKAQIIVNVECSHEGGWSCQKNVWNIYTCKLYFCRSNTFYIFFSFFFFLPSFVVQWGKNIFGRKLDVVTEKRSVSCSLYIK